MPESLVRYSCQVGSDAQYSRSADGGNATDNLSYREDTGRAHRMQIGAVKNAIGAFVVLRIIKLAASYIRWHAEMRQAATAAAAAAESIRASMRFYCA